VSEGAAPYDVVRSKQWRPKFAAITQSKYKAFVDRLVVASPTTREGPYLTGSGLMPHMGGTDEAAFAIDTRTGDVFAAMLEGGRRMSTFGIAAGAPAPPFLVRWVRERRR
jgi:hypothetical protein